MNVAPSLPSAPGPARRAAFDDLVRRHAGYMRRLALRRANGDDDLAADTLQELLAGAWRLFDPASGDQAFLIYVARSLRFAAINRGKSAKRWRFADPDAIADVPTTRTPEDAYAQAEARAALDRALEKLPCKQREALALVLGGATYDEAARALGSTVDAVHVRLKTARENLAALLHGTGTPLRGAEREPSPNVAAMARAAGVSYATYYARLRKGQAGTRAGGKTRERFEAERDAFRLALADAAAAEAFTARERAAVAAYYLEGQSVGQAAERLGTSKTALASTLFHARRTLARVQAGEEVRVRKGRKRRR